MKTNRKYLGNIFTFDMFTRTFYLADVYRDSDGLNIKTFGVEEDDTEVPAHIWCRLSDLAVELYGA